MCKGICDGCAPFSKTTFSSVFRNSLTFLKFHVAITEEQNTELSFQSLNKILLFLLLQRLLTGILAPIQTSWSCTGNTRHRTVQIQWWFLSQKDWWWQQQTEFYKASSGDQARDENTQKSKEVQVHNSVNRVITSLSKIRRIKLCLHHLKQSLPVTHHSALSLLQLWLQWAFL